MSEVQKFGLIRAVREGKLNVARALINTFDLSFWEPWASGYSLLCDALANRHEEMAKLLLTNGCQVNDNSAEPSTTPLHLAAKKSYPDIVQTLLQKRARVNAATIDGATPLHSASEVFNNVQIVKTLLDHGANVNARRKDGRTALHIASDYGHNDILLLLAERGGDVDARDDDESSPLHVASYNGYTEIVRTLAILGADLDARNKHGRTPLHLATVKGWPAIAEILINNGADIDAICGESRLATDYALLGILKYTDFRGSNVIREQIPCADYETPEHPYRDPFPFEKITKIIGRRIASKKALGIEVSAKNLEIFDRCLKNDNITLQFDLESKRLRNTKIDQDSDFTYHDIITASEYRLSVFFRNEKVFEKCERSTYKPIFPLYFEMIDARINRVRKKLELVRLSFRPLSALSGYILPEQVTREISLYLNNKELRHVVQAVPDDHHCDFATRFIFTEPL